LIDVAALLRPDPIGGSKLREAMSSGRIALSVDGPSRYQSSWIKNDVNGILVAPENFVENAANACIDLHRSPNKIDKIFKAAREYAVNNMDFAYKAQLVEKHCLELLHKN